MEEVLNQSVDTTSAPINNENLSPPQEKMLPQSKVNALIGQARQEGAARAVEEYRRSQPESAPQQPSYRESSSQPDETRFRQLAAEEAHRLRDQWVAETQQRHDEETAHQIVKGFYDKIEPGKQKYDDFDKITGDLELRRFPNIVQMLSQQIDNSHDVLYELGKNRAKLAQIEMTARDFPQEALYDLRRLSESVKKNDEVSGHRNVNAPLNQQRPSNVGTDSGGILSMRDLKAKYRV
jgi:hypothetical protein